MLSYKIITQIAATQRLLYQIGLTDSPICNRCKTNIETIEHKYWGCSYVKQFWKDVANMVDRIKETPCRTLFSFKKIVFGVPNDIVINQIISIGKSMITRQLNLTKEVFILKLKIDIANEKCMAQRHCKLHKFEEKWGKINLALNSLHDWA